MNTEAWRVGELAECTGLSVRTPHYYDAIELLVPSQRSIGEHRPYAERGLARLEKILALESLGLALHEIRECLAQPAIAPRERELSSPAAAHESKRMARFVGCSMKTSSVARFTSSSSNK